MKKQIIVSVIVGIFLLTIVSAVYLVNSLTLTVGVNEAFEVKYAILGDGENDYTGEDCQNAVYNTAEDIETGMLSFGLDGDLIHPGQKRFICAEIENGAGILPYTITGTIIGGDGSNYTYNQLCINAFGNDYLVTGDATASDGSVDGVTYDGFEVIVANDAPIVTGCKASIDVARG